MVPLIRLFSSTPISSLSKSLLLWLNKSRLKPPNLSSLLIKTSNPEKKREKTKKLQIINETKRVKNQEATQFATVVFPTRKSKVKNGINVDVGSVFRIKENRRADIGFLERGLGVGFYN